MLNRRHLLACLMVATAAPLRARAAEPLKILFVDTGNTGRSLMAETLAGEVAARSGTSVALISRGVDVDPFSEGPEPNARLLMAARGFDIGAHRARQLTSGDIAHADLILTMTATHAQKVIAQAPEAATKTFTLASYAIGSDEPIPDAFGKPMSAYEDVVAQLDRLLPLALAKAARR